MNFVVDVSLTLIRTMYCSIFSSIYYLYFSPQLSANYHCLFFDLTNQITWWKYRDPKIPQYNFKNLSTLLLPELLVQNKVFLRRYLSIRIWSLHLKYMDFKSYGIWGNFCLLRITTNFQWGNNKLLLKHTANRSAVNPTAFRSVPFQDAIQMQF